MRSGPRVPSPRRALPLLLLLCVAVAALVGAPARVAAAADDDRDPAVVLAERYAPVLAVKPHPEVCGGGEPYAPAAVESVLGHPDVTLVGPDGERIAAPTASDLHGRGDGWYLDLPGNPLDPGCTYARWWADMAASQPPTVYARVVQDPDEPGTVAVQYWFWWIFNDWNDKHEGDWEMVQLLFDAPSVEAALEVDPSLVVFAQHEGAQYLDWDDDALVLDGTHVVTHPGTGSHADYPEARLWFGKSASTGFGCDDSRGATERLEPAVVLVPSTAEDVSGPDDPFAWLTFEGRWGQKAPSFNNGPQGPNTKAAWAGPTRWVEEVGRESSVAVPPLGSQVTDFFCAASAQGSLLFVKALDEPAVVAVAVVVVVVALVLAVRATRWRPSSVRPVRAERRAGQLFTTAFRLQAQHPTTYLVLGAVVLAGGLVAALAQEALLDLTFLGGISSEADESDAWVVPLAVLAGAVVTIPAAAIARAGAAAVVRDVARDRAVGPRTALLGAVRPPHGTLAALVVQGVATLTAVVHLFLPVAVWLVARWGVATPEAVSDGVPVREALRRSTGLTRHHRWRTLGVAIVANLAVTLVGPFVGTVVLLVSDAGFELVNLVSGLVGVVLVPWAGTVVALLREDLVCRSVAGAGDGDDEGDAVLTGGLPPAR